MKKILVILILLLSSCTLAEEARERRLMVISGMSDIKLCVDYVPTHLYSDEWLEEIGRRNLDCNKYQALMQNKNKTKNNGIDWGAVADEIGKINNRNANQSQNNQIGEFCRLSGRRNAGNVNLCYYQCSKTGPLQIQIPYSSYCEINFYR